MYSDDEDLPERRRANKHGWTWTKEIVGTIIGAATIVVPLAFAFGTWLTNLDKQTAMNTIEIRHQKETADADRMNSREERADQSRKLDKIIDAVTTLQQQVARQSTGGRPTQ